jgi:hypothetical protein
MKETEWISDEIIFDYLEGNLSVEEREAFEFLMNDSELVTHEVKLWKNAYVKELLPDVGRLENSLIMKPPFGGTSQLKSFLLTLTFLIFFNSPSSNLNKLNDANAIAIPVFKSEQNLSTTLNDFDPYHLSTAIHEKINRQKEKDGEKLIALKHKEIVRLQASLSKPFTLERIQIRKISFVQTKLMTVAIMGKKKTVRKLRSLNALKRRNEIENAAAKFLSGREPYVVPLKSTDF